MMKKILLICVLLLSFTTLAAGFPQQASQVQGVTIPMDHLQLSYNIGDDVGVITEMIVFRNNGDSNYSGTLHTLLPADAEIMQFQKMDMTDAPPTTIAYDWGQGVLRWNASIDPNAMPIYTVMCVVPINATGTDTEPCEFVKGIVVNYSIGKFLLGVNTDAHVKLTDEANNVIKPDETSQEGDGGVLHTWSGPLTFKELHIELSQPENTGAPSNTDKWIVYGIIAVLILAALSYPIIHVKNNKLRDAEGGNKLSCASCSACSGDGGNEVGKEGGEEPRGGDWDEMDEIITEISQTEEDLIRKKRAILAVLNKLEEDRDAGAVSDSDYKRLSSKYEKQAIVIMKQLDQM